MVDFYSPGPGVELPAEGANYGQEPSSFPQTVGTFVGSGVNWLARRFEQSSYTNGVR